jgi:hypothetical protein
MQMPKTPKPSSEVAALYESYKRSGPLEDLRFYLRYAERKLAAWELGPETIARVGDMIALEARIRDLADTSSRKREVWTLISRFRASIPGWAGNAGAPDGWVGALEDDATYWRARLADLEDSSVRGPVSMAVVQAWHAPRAVIRDAGGVKVARRAVPLTEGQVRAMLPSAPTLPQTPPARSRRAKSTPTSPPVVATALTCPQCAGAVHLACGHRAVCASCAQSYHITLYPRHSGCRACGKTQPSPRVVRSQAA